LVCKFNGEDLDTYNAILTRRSIRQYQAAPVPDEYFRIILKAGMYAPSAMNLQPWDFIIINKPESIARCIQAVPHGENIIRQAPAAILVCGNNKIESNTDYLVQNCSASIQNILLEIHELGLGACWIAVYPIAEVISNIRNAFNLPEEIIPVALITLGFPAEEKIAEDRYKEEKIHYNLL